MSFRIILNSRGVGRILEKLYRLRELQQQNNNLLEKDKTNIKGFLF